MIYDLRLTLRQAQGRLIYNWYTSRFTFHVSRFTFYIFLLVACASTDDSWERIQETGVLRVGLDPTYPPFEVENGAEVVGLDVDLAQAVARELDLQVAFVYFGYDGLYDALATEQVDVLISALVIAPERTRDFAYSEPYFNAGQILVVQQETADIERLPDLENKAVAVELGAQGHVEAIGWQRKLSGLEVRPFDTPDEALTAVLNHEADAAIVDAISGRLYLITHPGLKRLPESVTVEPYAFVVRIEDQLLLEKLNDGLKTLQNSGQLDEIIAKWAGP